MSIPNHMHVIGTPTGAIPSSVSKSGSTNSLSTAQVKVEPVAASAHKPLILLVEDDYEMAHEISIVLKKEGYKVQVFDDHTKACLAARSASAALMIIDRMLRGNDSLEMIEDLRHDGVQVPILFLSALSSANERVKGLKAGADDYIAKPFSTEELCARVEALLRRSPASVRQLYLQVGPLKLDLIERKAWRGHRELSLLPREFKLLEYMMRHPNQVLTRTMLLENIWNYNFLQTNLVDVHMGKLRRKIDLPGEVALIRSIRLTGFILHASK